jgi:uncharacterized protein YutE (UPF0331/DUF86 family)
MDNLDKETAERLLNDPPPYEFLILKAHLLVENVLDVLIDASLERPECIKNRKRAPFGAKLEWAKALGALPESYAKPIKALNKCRNNIAHENYRMEVEELLKCLLDEDKDYGEEVIRQNFASNPKEATRTAMLLLVMRCNGLPYAAQRRR